MSTLPVAQVRDYNKFIIRTDTDICIFIASFYDNT